MNFLPGLHPPGVMYCPGHVPGITCTGTQARLLHGVLTGRLHLAAEPPTFCIEVFQKEKKEKKVLFSFSQSHANWPTLL